MLKFRASRELLHIESLQHVTSFSHPCLCSSTPYLRWKFSLLVLGNVLPLERYTFVLCITMTLWIRTSILVGSDQRNFIACFMKAVQQVGMTNCILIWVYFHSWFWFLLVISLTNVIYLCYPTDTMNWQPSRVVKT